MSDASAPLTRGALAEALSAVGLGRGDVVYLHSQLFGLGMMAGVRSGEAMCAEVLGAFRDVIGDEGTLAVPTFTTTVARLGQTFVLEETPADTGLFAEYVRTRAGAVRSLHPMNSVTALGPAADTICRNVSAANYGAETPFTRMLDLDAKAVNLGFSDRFSNSWHHLAEAMLGLPYLYNKLLSLEVVAGGRTVERPFFATVRYLDFSIANDLKPFDNVLLEGGHMARVAIGRSFVTGIAARLYYRLALERLMADPWSLLKHKPEFRFGERPWDGAPGRRPPP